MSRNRQLKIWSYLADLLTTSVEDQDTENTRLKLSHSSSFTGKNLKLVNYSNQTLQMLWLRSSHPTVPAS